MSYPVVIAEAVGPQAGRALAKRIAAWTATANISKLNAFRDFLARHPQLSSIAGSIGISSVIESALEGDPDSISALNDAAAKLGISVAESYLDATGIDVPNNRPASRKEREPVIDGEFSQTEITDSDAVRAQEMQNFARFIRSEVSTSSEFVLRHHALMRQYLAMDAESLENLLKAY